MGTNLINSIQHRNGPNQRPPNSIFGNSGSNQKLISNHLMCGCIGAITCGVALITYLNYTVKNEGPNYEIGILGILSIAFFILILVVACILLICHRKKKQATAVCIEPRCPDFDSENLVYPDESTAYMIENPPSYDYAVKMTTTVKIPTETLPPSYDNIIMHLNPSMSVDSVFSVQE